MWSTGSCPSSAAHSPGSRRRPGQHHDLVETAGLGLVYTTTVGLEMAMSGVPVIVIGQTHYRGKGFSLDPDSGRATSS